MILIRFCDSDAHDFAPHYMARISQFLRLRVDTLFSFAAYKTVSETQLVRGMSHNVAPRIDAFLDRSMFCPSHPEMSGESHENVCVFCGCCAAPQWRRRP
jgi:hypothetical protein